MNILNICNNPDILKAMRIVRVILTIIRIAGPIALIVSLMINYLMAVKDHDSDALNKANKTLAVKLIAAVILFAIPTFVNLIARAVDVNKDMYISCIKDATSENIDKALYDAALEKINNAKESLSSSDYSIAVNYVKKVKSDKYKDSINDKLTELTFYMDIKNIIVSLQKKFDKNIYTDAYNKVNSITDQKVKNKLSELLLTVAKGRPLNIEPGMNYQKSGNMEYYEIIPPNPTTNMPLVVFLHGDGGWWSTENVTQYVLKKKAYDEEEFFYIAPHPQGYSKGDYNKWGATWVIQKLKSVIDDVVNKYEIDKNKIIIMGYSYGAIGVWDTVSSYKDFFSAAVPVSCGGLHFKADSFKDTPVWAIFGDQGAEQGYGKTMKNYVNSINSIGGNAKYTEQKGKGHSDMGSALCDKEVFAWALKQ